jgi:hypothetical protein
MAAFIVDYEARTGEKPDGDGARYVDSSSLTTA